MALKEVFQHSIALSDIDPELTGVTRKQDGLSEPTRIPGLLPRQQAVKE